MSESVRESRRRNAVGKNKTRLDKMISYECRYRELGFIDNYSEQKPYTGNKNSIWYLVPFCK